MRILIAANSVDHEVCSGLSLHTFLKELLIKEVTPFLYSAHGTEHLQRLQGATVPIIEDLGTIGVRPDLIHGHHAADTLIALLFFPDVPALFFFDHEKPCIYPPLHFPRIIRHLAPNAETADELHTRYGIPSDRIQLLDDCTQQSGTETLISLYKDVIQQYRSLQKSIDARSELQITASHLRTFKKTLGKCEADIASLFDSLDRTRLQLETKRTQLAKLSMPLLIKKLMSP